MSIRDELHNLVDHLSDDKRAAEALAYLRSLINEDAIPDETALAKLTQRMEPRAVPGHAFFSQPRKDLATIAAQQGVRPVANFDDLLGDFWPEDESADEFIAAVRQWRRDGGHA